MVRLWRAALVLTALVALFFAATAVLPLSTVGDPAYDIPMLRARWYVGFLVLPLHGLALALTVLLGVLRPRRMVWLACGLLVACLIAILTEEARFIRFGELIDPHDLATRKLLWSRLATLVLSAGALWALWRADVRR